MENNKMTRILGNDLIGLHLDNGYLMIIEKRVRQDHVTTSFSLTEYQKMELALALLKDVDTKQMALSAKLAAELEETAGTILFIHGTLLRGEQETTELVNNLDLGESS